MYLLGTSNKIGMRVGMVAMTRMNFRYSWKISAVLEISNKDPPLNAASMIGNRED